MHHRKAVIQAAAVLLLACGPTEPAHGSGGTWVLRSVAGRSLPALVSDGSNLLVLSDTLEVGVTNPIYTGPLVHSSRRLGVTGGPPSASGTLYHLEQVGNLVTLRSVCPSNADCLIDVRSGEIDGTTMILEYAPSGYGPSLRSPLVYERIR
jgi:hypothetical protein